MRIKGLFKLHNIQEEQEPWLISYADLITLLFSFFAVLVGLSDLNLVKMEIMAESFGKSNRITMKDIEQRVQGFINKENLQADVSVDLTTKGVEINFKDKLLFALGDANLKRESVTTLGKMSNLFDSEGISEKRISVEGHTDSLPIKSRIYPSNWELSSARAANVVKYFISTGLNSKRFESIGYADTKPLKPEIDRSNGQPANRRVVVVISPMSVNEMKQKKEISVETLYKNIPQNNLENQNRVKENNSDLKKLMSKYFMLGQKYFKKKEYKKAIGYWKKVLKIDPEHQLSKVNIQRAKEKTGE